MTSKLTHDPYRHKTYLNLIYRSRCAEMRAHFFHDQHICMVFDLLAKSVFDFLKVNKFLPFKLEHVRSIAHQLLQGAACKTHPERIFGVVYLLIPCYRSPQVKACSHRHKTRKRNARRCSVKIRAFHHDYG